MRNMEDEDVDCITKIDAVSVENKLPCVPVSNEICKIISSENATISPSAEVECDVNSVKLLSASNHQETLTSSVDSENNEFSRLNDSSLGSPKKVNGEVDKIETTISEEGSIDCNETVEDLKPKELFVSEFEQTNKRKRPSSDCSDEFNQSDDESENKTSSGSSPVEFRGFKKRKILETEKEKITFSAIDLPDENEKNVISEPVKPKVQELRRSARNATMAKRKSSEQVVVEHKEENGDQLTEYAQYLGLQPTVKFKCGRCGEKHFQSMASLNAHQKMCCKSGSNALVKPTKPPGDSNLSTNFRITRKVYLCSACGTYYENWKLFLHMRDMHKRHICLFCLGMFSVADKLAEHLLFKHNVYEKACKSQEEFFHLFKGSCYLTCCSCEKMFTEREDFFDHLCKDSVLAASTSNKDLVVFSPNDNTQRCSLCGIKCGHFQSCPSIHNNRFQTTVVAPSTSVNSKSSPSLPSNISLTKYYIPVPPSIQKEWGSNNNSNVNKPTNTRTTTSDKDDYYDLGNAASFCHVDIENDSDTQTSSNKLGLEKRNSEHKTYSKLESRQVSPSKPEENNTNDEPSKNSASNNDVSSSSDESAPEKTVSDCLGTNESCEKENNGASQNNADEKNDDDDDIHKGGVDLNDDENDADDEQNSSEDCAVKTPKSVECDNDYDASNSEVECSDKKDESNSKETTLTPCFIKLNRIEGNSPENRIDKGISKTDDVDDRKIDNEVKENILVNFDSSDNISDDNISNSNNDSSDLKINNSLSNESMKTVDQKASESSISEEKKSSHLTDDETNAEKENINLEDNYKLNNPGSPPLLSENGFDCKENKDMFDKSDESEDSDKLSVVLPDEGSEETKDNAVSVNEKDKGNQETNLDHENTNCTENDTLECTDVSNDGNAVHNGNETIGDSNIVESQDNDGSNSSVLPRKEDNFKIDGEKFQLASEEVMAMALTLENKMDSLSSQSVIKECVRTSCTTCTYCSHAVKIGVNGKQLALHLLAEHRYMPVKNETVEDVIERLKNSLDELQDIWFNTDSYDSSDKSCFVPYDHTYDCFQCNYVTHLHKDLYHHYRKVHQKSILYCCMCKANFSSYSELICHMCPGLYVSKDIQFRCCFCNVDRIPSAFRLMVHLRKAHHTCDICLDIAEDQQKLSTHMWKHKLNHSCYRCGISYRNKPDITKHLFWKHGTESVLCRKCLHKRWPHVYHFCVPPTVFICEECNLSFSKAVVLKVHKRMHSEDFPYTCTSCEQKFISKKLLLKHEKIHNPVAVEDDVKVDMLPALEDQQKPPDSDPNKVNETSVPPQETTDVPQETEIPNETPVKQHKKKNKKDREKKAKPVVDVYDLPPLNLSSESDDSDDEKDAKASQLSGEENQEKKETEDVPSNNIENNKDDGTAIETVPLPNVTEDVKLKNNDATAAELGADNEDTAQPVTVVDGIWDSFHSYKAEQEKRENLDSKQSALSESDTPPVIPNDVYLGDHDYCITNNINERSVDENNGSEKPTTREHSSSIDHDYCTLNNTEGAGSVSQLNQEKHSTETPSKKKQKSPKKKVLKQHNSSSSSDSSSDSDSSCSCGDSSCSCSSSSSNSSSSSSTDSDSSSSTGRQINSSINKREKKKEKIKNKRKEEATKTTEPLPAAEEEPVVDNPVDPEEPFMRESDLQTDETSTDEEFYDEYPQRHANQHLAEKRNQLMVLAAVASENNGTASPPVPVIAEQPSVSVVNSDAPKIEAIPPSTPVPPIMTTIHPSKRKVKSKKRKKSSQFGRSAAKSQNNSYETPQPSTSFSVNRRDSLITDSPYSVSSPLLTTPIPNRSTVDNNMFLSNQPQQHLPVNTQSNSSKRQSKRRPVRNKFYGYSSEEEDDQHVRRHPPPSKWKKTTPDVNTQQHHVPPQQTQALHLQQQHHQPMQVQQQQYHISQSSAVPEYNFLPKVQSASQPIKNEDDHRNMNASDGLTKRVSTTGSSSSSEEDSESDAERTTINPTVASTTGIPMATDKDDKLYCYCQCPYDEVSEMIACDGVDCVIEWFHFECVGIMVPPKGKWYCPDCRKRRGLS